MEHVHNEYVIDSLCHHYQTNGLEKSREDIARDYYSRSDKDANILAGVAEQCDWLRAIGYQDVDCYFKVFELAVFGGRKPNRDTRDLTNFKD